jgi:hypothetical protein
MRLTGVLRHFAYACSGNDEAVMSDMTLAQVTPRALLCAI